jgi:DNA-binding PadR family transcriptional regulator
MTFGAETDMREFDFSDPGSWFGGGRGGGRHRRHRFDSGDMKYVILKMLSEKPMHGYEVMKALEEELSGCYKPSPGSVYPTLQWLEDEGLVSASDVAGKKVYSITDAGRVFLEENKGTVDDIFDRISDTINRFASEPIAEVNGAIGRVVASAYRAAWKHGRDDAQRTRLKEILERTVKELDELGKQRSE